jgi:DNA-binding response OmpR family regulator
VVTDDTPFEAVEKFILESFSIKQSFKRLVTPDDGIRSETSILDVQEDTAPEELVRFIRESQDANQQSPSEDQTDEHLQRQLILVAEDDIPTQRLERLILQKEGHLVKVTNRREEALRILKEATPSLILLNVGLPGEDGFTTCQHIRKFSQVPIIMVTGRDNADDRVKARDCGADDFLAKTFLSRELPARVQTLLDLSRSRIQLASNSHRVHEVEDLETLYEGNVPVIAQVTGSMRRLIEFTGELHDRLDIRLLRFQPHQSRVNMLLALRRPLALKKILLEMSSVERLEPKIEVEGQEAILVYLLP